MKKAFAVLGLALVLGVGATQSASALFLGCGTTTTDVGGCVLGWQATSVQLYIFGFEVGDSVPGEGHAC